MTRLVLAALVLAIDPTGKALADTVKTGAGNFFIAVLAVLGVVQLWRRHLLSLLVLLALAAVAAIFVYTPSFLHELSDAFVRVIEGT